jgi:transketolase C-terminal domain/subunit
MAVLTQGGDVTLVSYGIEINECLGAATALAEENIAVQVVKVNRLAPLDAEPVIASVRRTGCLVVAEDVCRAGGIGEQVLAALAQAGVTVKAARRLDLGDGILENGSPEQLRTKIGLDGQGIAQAIRECMDEKDKT